MRFCLCNFESDTVESDCPVQIFRKMMSYLKIEYLWPSGFTGVFSGD